MNYYKISNGTYQSVNAHLADGQKLRGVKDGNAWLIPDFLAEKALEGDIPTGLKERVWESEQVSVQVELLSFEAIVGGLPCIVTIPCDYFVEGK